MKKRLIAVALASTLTLGTMAAYASVSNVANYAGIRFQVDVTDGAVDPGDEGTVPGVYGVCPDTGDPVPGSPEIVPNPDHPSNGGSDPDAPPYIVGPPNTPIPNPNHPDNGGDGDPVTTPPYIYLPDVVLPIPNSDHPNNGGTGDPGTTPPYIPGDTVPPHPNPPTPPVLPPAGTLPPDSDTSLVNMIRDFGTMGLEFGLREMPTVETTFSSVSLPSDSDALPFTPDPTAAIRHSNTADVVIMAVSSAQWNLSVRLGTTQNNPNGQFRVGTQQSIPGSVLQLVEPDPAAVSSPSRQVVVGADDAITVRTNTGNNLTGGLSYASAARTVASGTNGIFGVRYEGLLTVPAFSAIDGRANADILWSFRTGSPGNLND